MDQSNTVFVIMPFGTDPADILHSRLIYHHVIEPAVQDAGFRARRIDLMQPKAMIATEIEAELNRAPLVIADVSGGNPNVMFELGYRRAHGKPFICIHKGPIRDTPFWAKNFQIVDYTKDHAREDLVNRIGELCTAKTARTESLDEVAELTKLINKDRQNNFEDRISAWRIRRSREQISQISNGDWEFETRDPNGYVAFMFEGLMELLEPGEEYCTVTNVAFWSEQAVGSSALLAKNAEAVRRGIGVNRIFIIGRPDLCDDTDKRKRILEVIEQHAEEEKRLRAEGRDVRLSVKCLLTDDFGTGIRQYGYFGLARKIQNRGDSGCVVMIPRYPQMSKPDESMTHLKFLFSRGPSTDKRTIDYVKKFERAWREGMDAGQFLERERNPKIADVAKSLLRKNVERLRNPRTVPEKSIGARRKQAGRQ